LISNPGELNDQNYCKGVYVDVDNYRNFLASAQGGAWNLETEFTILNKPTRQQLEIPLIKCELADYAFILFTGHGYFSDELQEPVLELREGETVCLSDLLAPNTKRTVILDSCQKVHRSELIENRNIIRASLSEGRRREPNRERCRQIFDTRIEQASRSAVIPKSCRIDEYSTADDELGSRYARSLIVAANRWVNQQSMTWQASENSYSIISAHDSAALLTTRLSGGEQNPTISKARTGPYFPFAVFD